MRIVILRKNAGDKKNTLQRSLLITKMAILELLAVSAGT